LNNVNDTRVRSTFLQFLGLNRTAAGSDFLLGVVKFQRAGLWFVDIPRNGSHQQSWRNEFTPRLYDVFWSIHGKAMDFHGYSRGSGGPPSVFN
jgi:hypothetical protein